MGLNEYAYTDSTHTCIIRPPEYKWKWCFNGDWHSLTVQTLTAPNAIQRYFAKKILGVHWEKINGA